MATATPIATDDLHAGVALQRASRLNDLADNMSKSRNSIERVRMAAQELGLAIDIKQMPTSTRTAEEAANACGCEVAQIVKSLIFEGETDRTLKLFLVSGAHQLNLDKAQRSTGQRLVRADPKRIRDISGFAIGGVAPIAQLTPLESWFDETLLNFDCVWAAAGAPNAVFATNPHKLLTAIRATCIDLI